MLHRLHTLALALLVAFASIAQASQNSLFSPSTGTVSGLQLTNNYNNALDALNTCNSGATAPANQLSGVPSAGDCWLDTHATPYALKRHDGNSHWVILGYIEPSSGQWYPVNGGGVGSIASAATTDIGLVSQTIVSVTGATTITSLGSSAPQSGVRKTLVFAGSLTLTCNATSLILPTPGCINITTQAGDVAYADYLGSGNWRVDYRRADGTAVNASSNFQGAVFLNSRIAPAALAGNTNNWNPAGLATANVIQFSCTSPFNITGLTAPATDGQEMVLDNIGATNPCTLTSQDTNSTAGNRFAFDRPIAVRPGRSVTIKYDLTAARWRLMQEVTSQPIASGFKNLKVTNGATPNNQLIVTADELTVEDASGGTARLSAVSCQADITGSGALGLDTSTVAQNTGYHFWVIFNPTTNATSCMFSLQTAFGSLTLPSGYTFAARVAWDFVENQVAKRLNRILCYGRRCQYVVTASSATASLPLIASGVVGTFSTTAPTWVAESVSTVAPATASRIMFTSAVRYNSGSVSSVLVAPNNTYAGPVSTNPPPYANNVGTSSDANFPAELTLESTNIYFVSSATGGALLALGWEDNL